MKLFVKVMVCILVLCLLAGLVIPALAAESAYSVEVTIGYYDEKLVKLEKAQLFSYTIQNPETYEYLTAVCEDGVYKVTGYSEYSSKDTSFQFGSDEESPSKLFITGFTEGEYLFKQESRVEGYSSVSPVTVRFTDEGVFLNDQPVSAEGNCALFSILMQKDPLYDTTDDTLGVASYILIYVGIFICGLGIAGIVVNHKNRRHRRGW